MAISAFFITEEEWVRWNRKRWFLPSFSSSPAPSSPCKAWELLYNILFKFFCQASFLPPKPPVLFLFFVYFFFFILKKNKKEFFKFLLRKKFKKIPV